MAVQTLQYMRGVFSARADFLSALASGDRRYEAEMSLFAVLFSLLSISALAFANHFTKLWFLSRQTFEASAKEYGKVFPFPWESLVIANSLYLILIIYFSILIILSALVLRKWVGVVPVVATLCLASPYFVLMYLTPSLTNLLVLVPFAVILAVLFPVIIGLLFVRFLFRTGKYLFQLDSGYSAVFTLAFFSFMILSLLIIWLFLPGGLV